VRTLYTTFRKARLHSPPMGRRIWGSVAALLVLAAAAAAGAASADRAQQGQEQTCPATRSSAPGWEAVFGRAASAPAAEAIRTRAGRVGFQHLVTQAACENGFEVVLRGICPMRVARQLQAEARKTGFSVVLQYKKPPDFGSDLVVVFGHFRTRAAADALKSRVETAGFKFVRVHNDGGCNADWEVLVGGVNSRAQAEELADEARHAGFPSASVEYA
jgi:cell division septation protein DedD